MRKGINTQDGTIYRRSFDQQGSHLNTSCYSATAACLKTKVDSQSVCSCMFEELHPSWETTQPPGGGLRTETKTDPSVTANSSHLSVSTPTTSLPGRTCTATGRGRRMLRVEGRMDGSHSWTTHTLLFSKRPGSVW